MNNRNENLKEEIEKLRKWRASHDRRIVDLEERFKAIPFIYLKLVDLAISNDPIIRLSSILKIFSSPSSKTEISQPIIEYVIQRAKDSNLKFEDLADALLNGCGDKAKEIVPLNVISSVYGFTASERWRKIIGSNPNSSSINMVRKCMGG